MISMFICDNGNAAIGVRYIFSISTATKIELTDILPVLISGLFQQAYALVRGQTLQEAKNLFIQKNMKTAGFWTCKLNLLINSTMVFDIFASLRSRWRESQASFILRQACVLRVAFFRNSRSRPAERARFGIKCRYVCLSNIEHFRIDFGT